MADALRIVLTLEAKLSIHKLRLQLLIPRFTRMASRREIRKLASDD
jgi:hypothetical protein